MRLLVADGGNRKDLDQTIAIAASLPYL